MVLDVASTLGCGLTGGGSHQLTNLYAEVIGTSWPRAMPKGEGTRFPGGRRYDDLVSGDFLNPPGRGA